MNETKNHELDALKRAVMLKRLQQSQSPKKTSTPSVHIPLADRSQLLPLSWPQQRLWFLHRLDPAASGAYHLFTALRISGRLDVKVMQSSLDCIMDRHDSLRTTFGTQGGQACQLIAAPGQRFPLSRHDLSGLPPAQRGSAMQALSAQQAQRPFDLAEGPLIRGQLVMLDPDQHVLLLCQHHIVTDGWSMEVLTAEFSELYRAFSAGQPDPLPSLTLQYVDYAAWQRGQAQGPVQQEQLAFWRCHLQGAPALLELPTDHSRPVSQSFAGSGVNFTVPPQVCQELRQLGQRHGTTLFMTVLAAWSAFLYRISGQPNIVVGTPIANRQTREVEKLIGYFANTLAVHVPVEGGLSVAGLLAQVKRDTLACYSHQDLPFEQVVEALNPERSLSYGPVFQVMFSLSVRSKPSRIELADLTISPIDSDRITAKVDLSLSLIETEAGLSGLLEYASDLFDASTIDRWAGHFQCLLASMVEDDQQPVDRLKLLTAAELQQLTRGFNARVIEPPQERLIHARFEAQVAQQPQALAVVDGQRRLSYAELNRRANQLAHHLLASGIEAEERVAVCAERSVELIVAMLGILKAGAAYVPLDPALPQERQAFMLADSQARMLLTASHLQQRLPDTVPKLLLDQPDWAEPQPQHDPALAMQPERLAYVIYTSGSTGQAKGVMVRHRNVIHLTVGQPFIDFSPRHCLAYCANPAFDASTWEIWGSLLNGARLVVVSAEVLLEPARLSALLRQEEVTILQLIAGLLKRYAQSMAEAISRVEYLIFGGDQSELHTVLDIWHHTRPCKLIHAYGPTETTTFTTDYEVGQATLGERLLPIGRAIASSQLYVLDAHLQPVPLGVQGEIYIGGGGVARGYLNRPELTAECFLRDPFSQDSEARLYKTGDLGRYRPDGNLDFLGRNDAQVKLRGYRIELGEIELRLAQCTGVKQAFAMVKTDAAGDKRLVAYVTGTPAEAGELRAQLGRHLPEYMLPAAFVTLESFPLTVNGKVDRQALPEPDAAASATRVYAAPQGDVEVALAEIWQELLHVAAVGRDDHFFELGGHSLMVIAMVEHLRHRHWLLEVRRVFDTPVLARLAECVTPLSDSLASTVPANLIPPGGTAITPEHLPLVALTQANIDVITRQVDGGAANVQDIYPVMPLQEGILFHHLLERDGDIYLSRTVLEFEQRAPLDAFLGALQSVIERYDVLRTAVFWDGLPAPVQVVLRHATLRVDELSPRPGVPALDQLLQASDPRHLRIDLRRAPLLSARLIAADGGSWLLALLHHHIVTDHVSLDVVLREIHLLDSSRHPQLPQPVPFRNFVARSLATPMSVHQDHFRRQLADFSEPSAPFGLLEMTGTTEETRRELDAGLAAQIRLAARRRGVTPGTLFHVAWARVVALCSGRDDVVFGTVLSGRMDSSGGAGQVVGMLINTLPLRVSLRAVSVVDCVAQTHRGLSELMRHEHAPLAMAQQCSSLPQGVPLFTNILNFRHGGPAAEQGEGNSWGDLRIMKLDERSNYPLTASIDDRGVGFAMTVQASGVSSSRIAGYLEQAIASVVQALGASAAQPMHTLSVMPPAEVEQLTRSLTGSTKRFTQEPFIHRLFEQQVRQQPAAPALEFQGHRLSYAELNRRANQVAHRLRAMGVQPDDRVAVCFQRGIAMVVAALGVLKAGGAYVPLDPGYPVDRLTYMLADCGAVALLAHPSAAADLLASATVPPTPLLDGEAAIADEPSGDLDPLAIGLRPDHLACVIYTSGSTGRPKGAMNRHDGLCNLVHDQQESLGVGPGSRVLQFASFSFDASAWELIIALCSGATLVLAAREAVLPGEALAKSLKDLGISHTLLPSSAVIAMPEDAHLESLCLLIGGDVCPPALAARWARSATVFNVYGPTEASVYATTFRCGPELLPKVPLGRPLANVSIHILDTQGQLVPVGVIGEIAIGGAGVGQGYLNRPELTAERFIEDPFSAEPGARLYKTGDLGRWLPDGNLDYVGRRDFQVKLRGFRIELGEIEARLLQCEGVSEAAVLARRDEPGEPRLVAYLRPQDGVLLDPAALRSQLAQTLPNYMLPAAFVSLAKFPLTASGKVDRQALPAPGAATLASRPYEAPQGDIETALATIWQNLLQTDRVGRHDDFFALGGHSLLAIQLVSRVRHQIGVELALTDLYEHTELACLATCLARSGTASLQGIARADRSAALRLSWAQERLWFFDQLDREAGVMYNLPSALRLSGALDPALLQATFDRIVQRHENLRTTFVHGDDGAGRMLIRDEATFVMPLHDLSGLPLAQREAEIQSHRRHEALTLFDLAAGPLVRGRLLRLAPDEHLLLVTQHHLISDGWSVGLMVREVNALYGALRAGRPDPLPPLAIQYADYVVWQRAHLSGAVFEAQAAYWKARLADAPTLLELPLDHPRPVVQSFDASNLAISFSPALTAALQRLCARHGCTMFMVLLAGWSVLLARLSGQAGVVVGTGVANRQRVEAENLIGLFVNTLCLHVRIDGSATVAQLLAQVRTDAVAAYAHQDLPFDHLLEQLNPPRSLAHNAVFQTMLSMNETPTETVFDLGELSVSALEPEVKHTAVDLMVSLRASAEAITGHLSYASALFDADTIARWSAYFESVLTCMAADDQQPLHSLSLVPPEQKIGLARQFNPPLRSAEPVLIQALFEERVAIDPSAVAVAWDDQTLSYAELNRRANQLAHQLMRMGVRPGRRVAICAGRTAHMLVAVLGVLKAGAAYVPLDPAYPEDRLAWLLQDSAPVALLTEAALEDLCPPNALRQTILLDELQPDRQSYSDPTPAGLTPEHAAYVVYTSGSTGQPKGVVVPHRALGNTIAGLIEVYDLDADSRVLQFVSFGFDVCVSEIMMALCSGARLCLIRTDQMLGTALTDCLKAHGITHAGIPVGALASLPLDAELGPLRTLITGGDVLPVAVAAHWGGRYPLFNSYGPTETAITATVHLCLPRQLGAGTRTVPIGRPLPNVQIYVLDADLEPVVPGVFGEIFIGGAGVSAGYLNRPELNAERFLDDPFSEHHGARMYRSGDMGRWLKDGSLEFRGREDTQVKIRGFRIELTEIETVLSACEGVAEAVVVAKENARGDKRLVAFLCARPGAVLSSSTIRQHLLTVLPEYMVPNAQVTLDEFKLTPHGKVDRQWLLGLDVDALTGRHFEAPQGDLEMSIAQIWQELLGCAQVGRLDDFFELGGHSLMAVQMVSRLRQALGVEMALGELFGHPILEAFAHRVGQARRAGVAPIPLVDRQAPLPLSWSQQRLWFLDQLDPSAGAAYHMPTGLRLSGRLDVPALRATLDRIVARHEVLRTTFVQIDGQPVQRIGAADSGFQIQQHDLQHLRGHEQEFAVERIGLAQAGAAFDLAQGPLISGQLLRLAPEEHVLLIRQHHIISDGWSIAILVREVRELYTAYSQGLSDPLPQLALQYADYAAWQRAWLQGQALQAQIDYWRSRLAGAPELLDLPLDRPRPPVQSHDGAKLDFSLAGELRAGLEQLAQRHGATLFMALLAGWAIVMSRLSGQRDVVIGTPVANRQRREIEDLIGFFVNTLALRVSTEGAPSVAQLLDQVRIHTLEAYAYQDLPFEQVVEALQPQRSRSHSPLFQTLLTLDNTPGGHTLSLPGLRLSGVDQRHGTAQFDTSVSLRADGDGLAGTLVYAVALFDGSTARRLVRCYQAVLRSMVDQEQQAVDRIVLIDAAERRTLTQVFNATAMPRAQGTLVHGLFESCAREQPQAKALVHDGQAISYAELNRRANRLAHRLIGLGVKPGALVAVCLPRSADMVAALLAILKAGGAYVPLDPAYPEDRLAYLLQDSTPAVLLTHSSLTGKFAQGSVPVVLLDSAVPTPATAHDDTNPDAAALGLGDGDLAYVLYTSGSTGLPKGVMIEHRSTVNLLLWARENYSAPELSSTLFATSINFDLHVFEMLVPLICGAGVTLASDVLAAPDGVTLVNTVPSAINALIDAGRLPASVRAVNLAGEALSWATVERIFASGHVDSLANLYGPTETTTYSTWTRMARHSSRQDLHIGKPLDNTQVHILDVQGQLVPIGVAGEIHIGGAGVARGYLNRPELTAERFIDDPFSSEPGARMYRTGDLGRWRPDGNIEYMGRNDFQVKLRGFRVELGEIESRLRQCHGVAEAAVLARADQAGGQRLVAYLLLAEGAGTEPVALRTQLSESLPDYMIPTAFVVLAQFPLTPNGKLDRKALPAPDASALASRPYEAPQGAAELAVASIWQALLQAGPISRHDDFFALGGHSLLAVQLVSRLRQTLGLEVPLSELFTHPDLAGFAARLAHAGANRMGTLSSADRSVPLPLSWAQQRLWFLDQLDASAGAAYHLPVGLRLRGPLNREALRKTLDRIVQRHEVLRTSFVASEGEPVQRIAAACGFPLVERDLGALAGPLQQGEIDRCSAEVFQRPFDLATGPLIRGQLLRLADNEHLLLINQHHIVSDAWSISVLVNEVCALYTAFSRGQADPLPPLALQYADYAAWQRGWLQGGALQAQTDFWKTQLAGAPELLDLPLDRPRPATQSYAGASVDFKLPAELSQGLKQLGQCHGATLFMTLLAGWGLLMARLSGQDDVVIGTPVANRQRREVEALIGYFLNTLALRVRVEEGLSVAGFLAQTQRAVLQAYAHQDVPFEHVLDAVRPARSLSHNPLFQAMLTLNNVSAASVSELPGLVIEPLLQPHTATYCDLYLAMREAPDGIAGSLIYATDLFDEATVQRMVGNFQILLAAMVADDQAAVLRLPLIDAAELALQWDTWNRSEQSFPLEQGYVALFEEQVRLHPQRLAATDGSERLTYRELDERASRLALALIEKGAGPETLVTLMCERSVMMLSMMLAVFKAGAAFLPLDIKHPPARLLEIVEMSGSPLVLVSEPCHAQVKALAAQTECKILVADACWLQGEVPRVALRGTPDDLAYVIFTSGSTGKPKGAMVEQRGMLNHMFGKLKSLALGPDDTLAQTASPAFDICVWQFLSALLVGACTAILKDPIAYDPERLLAAVEQEPISVLQTVPSMMRSLLDACHDGTHLTTLRCLIPTGEALSNRLTLDWLTRFPGIPLVNMYGPAECSDDVTWHPIHVAPEDGLAIPIGRPTANNRIYILDRSMQPVPIGVKGEICVDGVGVGRGYLNDPVQTAAAFPPHPLGRAGRFYRTGDVGRYRPDGLIEFHGRIDFQVKLRGFRIELAEIEARLARCPGVVEAVVLVREDRPHEKRLVAYLTGTPPEAAVLRQQLGTELPDYMVPTAFVTLPRLPCTPNGKLDRKALPVPDLAELSGRPYEPPQGEIEEALAAIWQELLGDLRVGRNDHFFELGGSSLVASQVVVRVRRRLGIEVPLMQVFQTPVLADLAEGVVLLELKRFESADIDLASADLAELSESELETMLQQERQLRDH